MLLKNKTVVLTGCNRGIGKAILGVFAKNGASIWACVRQLDDDFIDFTKGVEDDHEVNITPVPFDLADEGQVKEGINTIRSAKQPVDILVNNAGVIFTALFQMTSVAKMKEVFEINYFSQILLTQSITKIMARQKAGNIISISSSAAIEGNEGRMAYASSKAAIIASTKVMAKELAMYNIRVNAIAPGLTETDMMQGSTSKEALEYTLKRICMRRIGKPEEIANVALFLSSELSTYMTGQVLRVDGGM
jgi:3-oxoacyl-[acyl-carrier protein] reductase